MKSDSKYAPQPDFASPNRSMIRVKSSAKAVDAERSKEDCSKNSRQKIVITFLKMSYMMIFFTSI